MYLVPSSPVQIIDGMLDTAFRLTLTSDTVVGAINLQPGKTYNLIIQQDGPGGHAMTTFSSLVNAPIVNQESLGRTFAGFICLDDGNGYSCRSSTYA